MKKYKIESTKTPNTMEVSIAGVTVNINLRLSACCMVQYLEDCKQGYNYRTCFVKAIFWMFEKFDKTENGILTLDDFLVLEDDILVEILEGILLDDEKVRKIYKEMVVEDIFEKFYKANKVYLDDMYKETNKILQSSIHSLIPNLEKTLNDLSHVLAEFSKINFPFFDSLKRVMKNRIEWDEKRDVLLKFGWFYTTVLPQKMIDDIYQESDSLKQEDVEEMIVEYFRQNDCEVLKLIISEWKELPYFKNRRAIFEEALECHIHRLFNASTIILTLHTEGVITDFVRLSLSRPRYQITKAIEDIKNTMEKVDYIITIEEDIIYSDVIEQIEKTFEEKFQPSNPDASSNKSRHKIAHGHVCETESEVNSLKQFLYLNELYYLFVQISHVIPIDDMETC